MVILMKLILEFIYGIRNLNLFLEFLYYNNIVSVFTLDSMM